MVCGRLISTLFHITLPSLASSLPPDRNFSEKASFSNNFPRSWALKESCPHSSHQITTLPRSSPMTLMALRLPGSLTNRWAHSPARKSIGHTDENVSHTPMYHIHRCITYTNVSHTPMYRIHRCITYTDVSHTPMYHIHRWKCIAYPDRITSHDLSHCHQVGYFVSVFSRCM